MHVRVEDQNEDARVVVEAQGQVLLLRRGLVGPRAFVALVLALGVLEESGQYMQCAG